MAFDPAFFVSHNRFAVPRECRFLDALPRYASVKVLKNDLACLLPASWT